MGKDDEMYEFGNGGLIKTAFSIRDHAMILELRLRGYKFTSSGEGLIDTGGDLIGDKARHKVIALVETFCQNSNLIGDKKEVIVSHQKLDVAKLINEMIAVEIRCPIENKNAVVELVRQTLHNVTSITSSSRGLVQNILMSGVGEEDKNAR